MLKFLGLNLDLVEWEKIDNPDDLWCAKYQAAKIIFDKK